MKKVLMISYYFPPIGLAGSVRVVKFIKYLRFYGWDSVVLTSRGVKHTFEDQGLADDLPKNLKVFRALSIEHDSILPLLGLHRSTVVSNEEGRRKLAKLENFFMLPDSKALWFYPAVLKAIKIVKSEGIDVIFSTSPPLTAHLISIAAGRLTGKPVVLDYRDAWYENPFGIFPTAIHQKLLKGLEKLLVTRADFITGVNRAIVDGRWAVGAKKSAVIPHGFDPEEFPGVRDFPVSDKLIFAYAGSITYITNPEPLFEAFNSLVRENPSMKIEVRVYSNPPEAYRRKFKAPLFRWDGFVSRREIPERLVSAHVLLATIDKRARYPYISTSKIYDYIGAGRPILGVVPRGTDAWREIEGLGNSFLVEPGEPREIAKEILEIYRLWKSGGLKLLEEDKRKMFDRKRITAQLAEILNEVI